MAKIEQSVEVHVPVRMAYDQLMQFAAYPRFMESVREVTRKDDAHFHWRAEKGGKEIEWDAEITEQVPDKVIAWRNVSGPKNIGRVAFQSSAADTTRVTLSLDTEEAMTGEIGKAAKQRLERDLQSLKGFIEAQSAATKVSHSGAEAGKEGGASGSVTATSSNGNNSSNGNKGTSGTSITNRTGITSSTDATSATNGSHAVIGTNGNGGAVDFDHSPQRAGANQGRREAQQSVQSSFNAEGNMAEQGGSMQFSGEVNQTRSPSGQNQPSMITQAWAQPTRMMTQMTHALGQMPARMLEQEASML